MNYFEDLTFRITKWVGTSASIILHTLFFIGIFGLAVFGVDVDSILLILTTAVSLEAIYLAIFIQMSVNKSNASILDIQEDVEEIQEDVEDIQEDVEDIGEVVIDENGEQIVKPSGQASDTSHKLADIVKLRAEFSEVKELLNQIHQTLDKSKSDHTR
ncbi:MAG: hypothetical protein AAGF07_00395 [Patescibacteria group bacterium]